MKKLLMDGWSKEDFFSKLSQEIDFQNFRSVIDRSPSEPETILEKWSEVLPQEDHDSLREELRVTW